MTLVYPYGPARASGLLKSCPQDFRVIEELGFEPDGAGEHLFLWIEKNGLSTMELIERVARDYAIHPRLIGHSGLKDKHAICQQWLSLHLPGKAAPEPVSAPEGYRELVRVRHHSKLRPGTHKFNYFEVCLREVEGFSAHGREQLQQIVAGGFANYFGAQRFGRSDNVQQALLQLGRKRLSRQRKGLLISSLRSHLFNQLLSRRIEQGHWAEALDGDVFMLRGSHSIFSEPLNDDIQARFADLDIAPTGSLYGAGSCALDGLPLAIEQSVFAEQGEVLACLEGQRSKRQMRALRAVADDFDYDYEAGEKVLRLGLRLPAGSYVTSLLDHFMLTRENRQAPLR